RGPGPSRFFTLRAAPNCVTGYLPEDRELLMRQRGRRNYEVDVHVDDSPGEGEVRSQVLIAPEADGLAAYLVSAGAGAAFSVPTSHPASCGQYTCVVRGSLESPQPAGTWSLRWLSGGESPAPERAGEEGAQVLFLQFPAPTTVASN